MKDFPLISIVVPVYKAEKYIHRCLRSILQQTFVNWECILVDDGSPDNSGKICDEFAEKDSRIKVIHQENQGVSKARQNGLDNAIGDYVIQFDSDDWVESHCLERLLEVALRENADVTICDMYLNIKNRQEYSKQGYPNITAKRLLDDLINQRLHGILANKLIKRSCLLEYNIRIPEKLILSEDLYFCCALLRHHVSVAYLSEAFYHYQRNENSLTNSVSVKAFESKKTLIEEMGKILPSVEYNNFFALKKTAIWDAFFSKTFDVIPTTYPEIHSTLKKQKYDWKSPLPGCIALAIKGYPRFAYTLYSLNMRLLNKLKSIKFNLRHV